MAIWLFEDNELYSSVSRDEGNNESKDEKCEGKTTEGFSSLLIMCVLFNSFSLLSALSLAVTNSCFAFLSSVIFRAIPKMPIIFLFSGGQPHLDMASKTQTQFHLTCRNSWPMLSQTMISMSIILAEESTSQPKSAFFLKT